MKKTYTVGDLLKLIRSHIILIMTVMILGGTAIFAFSKLSLPLKYSSSINMYVQNATAKTADGQRVNNITDSKQLIKTYMEVMTDDAVMDAVGDILLRNYYVSDLSEFLYVDENNRIPASTIRNLLTLKYLSDSSIIKVTATCTNAVLAADICNAVAQVSSTYVQRAVGAGSVNAIDKAKVFPDPVSPDVPKNTIIGMVAIFLFMFMLIVTLDYLNNTVKLPEELGKKFRKPIIGEVRRFGNKSDQKSSSAVKPAYLLTDKRIPFSVVESYKLIRANIIFTIANSEKKIIAVSSAEHGEGKSLTAANIAIALAQTGSKVLLVDGDLRAPSLHKTFRESNDLGLSTMIIRKSSMLNSIIPDIADNLDLLPSGPIPPNPSELIGSKNFGDVLERLSGKYDYIIIDTPPLNVVSDAVLMKDAIGGIVLVVRYASTTYDKISSCVNEIEFADAELLGFVVNEVSSRQKSDNYNYL